MAIDNVEFLRLMEEVLEEKEGALTGNESLENVEEWDSLAVVSFIAAVDEKYGVTISPSKLASANSVPALIAVVEEQIGA